MKRGQRCGYAGNLLFKRGKSENVIQYLRQDVIYSLNILNIKLFVSSFILLIMKLGNMHIV